MTIKCLTCGEEMEVHKYSSGVELFGGGFCRDATMKKEVSNYCGRCPKCGTEFQITGEQISYVKYPKKESV